MRSRRPGAKIDASLRRRIAQQWRRSSSVGGPRSSAPDQPPRRRVEIANRCDGGLFYWLLKLFCFAGVAAFGACVAGGVVLYLYFAGTTPAAPAPALFSRTWPAPTRLVAADGTVLGEFASEWRALVPLSEIPPEVVSTFVDTLDPDFYEHSGLDLGKALARAWSDLDLLALSRRPPTITERLAAMFLRDDGTLARSSQAVPSGSLANRLRAAILAKRLEARYPKKFILAAFLNHVYLGDGLFGVRAGAARRFQKELAELRGDELDALARSVSDPRTNSGATGRRRSRRQSGFLGRSPYFARLVRSTLQRQRQSRQLTTAPGAVIETTVDPVLDRLAARVIDDATRRLDKRQGWRGPEARLFSERNRTRFRARAARLYHRPLVAERRYLALVEEVTAEDAVVSIGRRRGLLPIDGLRWARRWSSTDATNDLTIAAVSDALSAGDVVWVTVTPAPELIVALEQPPHPQGALLSCDLRSGYVLAMAGGSDFSRSQFNRAWHAVRQPGSAFKPLYYALALDRGYSYDTELSDVARPELDLLRGKLWTPENYDGTSEGVVSLESALVRSRNVPSVNLLRELGPREVVAWARRLGLTGEIYADSSLALGSSSTRLPELLRAYALFPRGGRWIDWTTVRRIMAPDGSVLVDRSVFFDPYLPPRDRIDRLATSGGAESRQVIEERTANLTDELLKRALRLGHPRQYQELGVPAAGKTGTSSNTMDTLFVGYTRRWATAVWFGDDHRLRPLGRFDRAATTALPAWIRYMRTASSGYPSPPTPPVTTEERERPRPSPPGARGPAAEGR